MKKILSFLLIFGAVILFNTSCGDDVLQPVIDESTITCSEPSTQGVTISFKAKCPEGTSVKVRFLQRTNGSEEKMVNAQYRSNLERCYAYSLALVGGSTYAYYVVGYGSDEKECYVSTEHTFEVPKNPSPDALVVKSIKIYSPSSLVASDGYLEGSVLTEAVEYSVDEEKTWTAVTEERFIRGLCSGKVILRIAETPTTKVGKTSYVIVPPYKSNTDLDGGGGTSEGVTSTGPKQ